MKIEEEDIYPRLDVHLSPDEQSELSGKLGHSGAFGKYEVLEKLMKMKERYLFNS